MIINMNIPSISFKKKKYYRYTARKMKDDNSIGTNYNVQVTCEKGVVMNIWKRIFICFMRIKILKNIVKRHFFRISLLKFLEKEKHDKVWMNLWWISYQILRLGTCLITGYWSLNIVDLLSIMILVIWNCLRNFYVIKYFKFFSQFFMKNSKSTFLNMWIHGFSWVFQLSQIIQFYSKHMIINI